MLRPTVLIAVLWLLRRPWPEWLQAKFRDTPLIVHSDGSRCRDRWCIQHDRRRHW